MNAHWVDYSLGHVRIRFDINGRTVGDAVLTQAEFKQLTGVSVEEARKLPIAFEVLTSFHLYYGS